MSLYKIKCVGVSHVTAHMMSCDLVLGLDMPSSTQQICVTSSPTSTTHAELNPALYVAHTLSCTHTHKHTHTHTHK